MQIVRVAMGAGTLLVLAWSLAAQGRAPKHFTLSGTVLDGNNRPLPGIDLSLSAQGNDLNVEPATSDGQGRFVFASLPQGEYYLSAAGGFGLVPYGETAEPFRGTPIHLGGENGDQAVVFYILPRSAIAGVIRDEFGDPMVRVNVSIARPLWRDGAITVSSAGQKSTDDRGRYRFGNLAPGTYTVCIAGGQGNPAPVQGPVDYSARVDNHFYARTCNRAFPLAPGQSAQVDLTPSATATATIRGHVRNAPSQAGFSVHLQPDDSSIASPPLGGFVDTTQSTFTFRGVPPGNYTLRAQSFSNAAQKSLVAEVPVEVGSSDIADLDVVLGQLGAVHVAFHDAQGKPPGARLFAAGSKRRYSAAMGPSDDGVQFQEVAPGSYLLDLRTSADTCLESVKLGDSDIRTVPFRVEAGATTRLDATISRSCGTILVHTVRDGAPVGHAKVVVLPAGALNDPVVVRENHSDDNGVASFSGLARGRYLVWAWSLDGPGAMVGPASLGRVERQATAVDVTAGGPVRIDVPLLAPGSDGR